jgi:hypothetical protein
MAAPKQSRTIVSSFNALTGLILDPQPLGDTETRASLLDWRVVNGDLDGHSDILNFKVVNKASNKISLELMLYNGSAGFGQP